MTVPQAGRDHVEANGMSRRAIVRGAAWSVPVVAAAVAMPLAAASTALAVLTYQVAPIVDVNAPYGTTSITVSNTSAVPYTGPITFSTASWVSVAPFSLSGATPVSAGGETVWTIPAVTVPAHTSMLLALVWDGPYPASAEQRPLAAVVDATAATITASGATTVASPYQLLWYAATPGGQGDPAGTTSFFIGNTTETPFIATGAIRIELWTFPLPSVRPITTGGTRYAGERALEGGTISGRYLGVPLSVGARTGRQVFTFDPQASTQAAQAARLLRSIDSDASVALETLGDLKLYAPYRPPAG